jgi:hypothetical protein
MKLDLTPDELVLPEGLAAALRLNGWGRTTLSN